MAIKKSFLDFLYEERNKIQKTIDDHIEKGKAPMNQCCENMINQNAHGKVLEAHRNKIKLVNDSIEKYIEIHIEKNG